jgi:hypothetical protein
VGFAVSPQTAAAAIKPVWLVDGVPVPKHLDLGEIGAGNVVGNGVLNGFRADSWPSCCCGPRRGAFDVEAVHQSRGRDLIGIGATSSGAFETMTVSWAPARLRGTCRTGPLPKFDDYGLGGLDESRAGDADGVLAEGNGGPQVRLP